MFDNQPLPRLSRRIHNNIKRLTKAKKKRQGTFDTDPRVSQEVLARCVATENACPQCSLLGKPATIHTYFRRFDHWQIPGSLESPSIRLHAA